MVKASGWGGATGGGWVPPSIVASESLHEYPSDAADRVGISRFCDPSLTGAPAAAERVRSAAAASWEVGGGPGSSAPGPSALRSRAAAPAALRAEPSPRLPPLAAGVPGPARLHRLAPHSFLEGDPRDCRYGQEDP